MIVNVLSENIKDTHTAAVTECLLMLFLIPLFLSYWIKMNHAVLCLTLYNMAILFHY